MRTPSAFGPTSLEGWKPLNSELDHYLELEHLMRLAKARARQLLAPGQ